MPTQAIFIAVAKIINEMYQELDTQNGAVTAEEAILQIAQKFTAHFAIENPRFNEDKFLKACFKEAE